MLIPLDPDVLIDHRFFLSRLRLPALRVITRGRLVVALAVLHVVGVPDDLVDEARPTEQRQVHRLFEILAVRQVIDRGEGDVQPPFVANGPDRLRGRALGSPPRTCTGVPPLEERLPRPSADRRSLRGGGWGILRRRWLPLSPLLLKGGVWFWFWFWLL